MTTKIKAGVIGVGYLGRFHAEKYAALPDVDLVGVADLNPDRAREVVHHLLEFSRTRKSSTHELVDLVALVNNSMSLVRNQLRLGGIVLRYDHPDQPVLVAEGEVTCCVADFVATVVADTPFHAREAANQVEVDYEVLTPIVDPFEALQPDVDRIMRAGVGISRSRPPEAIGEMMREHEMIVEAIRAQDGDGAALAMRWHLSQGRKRLMP